MQFKLWALSDAFYFHLYFCGLYAETLSQWFIYDFSDRCRTTINVLGDSFGAGIVQHMSAKELGMLPEIEPSKSSKEEIDMVEVASSKPEWTSNET